jgi:hypothetical protein
MQVLLEEFCKGIGEPVTEATAAAYKVLNAMYMADKMGTKEEVYDRFLRSRNDWMWIDKPQIGHGRYAINTCKTLMDDDEAVALIADWFGFQPELIRICGPAYYEATDWNYIRFMVKGYPRVLHNDSLWDVWR